MQGGSEGAEPNDFNKIKKMLKSTTKAISKWLNKSLTFKEDFSKKEKLSRAELQERAMKRVAYMQGGSEGIEPNDYSKIKEDS